MRRVVLVAATALAASAGGGCRGQTSEDPPILVLRNMWAQERYNPQDHSAFFADHRTMRPTPAGAVAREGFLDDPEVATGRAEDDSGYVLVVPRRLQDEYPGGVEAFLARGQERYNIYCTPCHGRTGDGQGIVVRRAVANGFTFQAPPTFHFNREIHAPDDPERLRHVPDGQIFATITHGVRNMPPYAAQIPVTDRWAIVAYVRALQLSDIARPQEPAQ